MGQKNITGLPRPAKRFCPDSVMAHLRKGKRFETVAEARAEDAIRRQMLVEYQSSLQPGKERQDVSALLKHLLLHASDGLVPTTLASSEYMGGMRFRIGGALWQLASQYRDAKTFTIIPRGWEFDSENFRKTDPKKLLRRLECAVVRNLGENPSGFLIGGIHGEFHEDSATWLLHFHGFADGDYLQAVHQLRKLPNYRRQRSKGDKLQRVRILRKPPENLPLPLLYLFQSFWPKRWRSPSGNRSKRRYRIPNPYHSEMLLWLHRWQPHDIALLMGIHVGKQGFQVRSKNAQQKELRKPPSYSNDLNGQPQPEFEA